MQTHLLFSVFAALEAGVEHEAVAVLAARLGVAAGVRVRAELGVGDQPPAEPAARAVRARGAVVALERRGDDLEPALADDLLVLGLVVLRDRVLLHQLAARHLAATDVRRLAPARPARPSPAQPTQRGATKQRQRNEQGGWFGWVSATRRRCTRTLHSLAHSRHSLSFSRALLHTHTHTRTHTPNARPGQLRSTHSASAPLRSLLLLLRSAPRCARARARAVPLDVPEEGGGGVLVRAGRALDLLLLHLRRGGLPGAPRRRWRARAAWVHACACTCTHASHAARVADVRARKR